jgi:hypothetical protein
VALLQQQQQQQPSAEKGGVGDFKGPAVVFMPSFSLLLACCCRSVPPDVQRWVCFISLQQRFMPSSFWSCLADVLQVAAELVCLRTRYWVWHISLQQRSTPLSLVLFG